jgi:hypothetical protein
MARRRLLAWHGVVLAAIAGCSSGASGSAVTAAQACGDFADAKCQKLQSCAPFLVQRDFGDLATCAARFQLVCPSGVAENGSTAMPGAVDTCARAFEAESCSAFFADYASSDNPPACALSGSLPFGAACADDDQCASAFCRKVVPKGCGVCATRSPEGGACGSSSDCEPTGLTCVGGSCIPMAVLGAACDPTTQPCGPLLYCPISGACVALLGPGGTCDPNVGPECDSNRAIYCNLISICTQTQIAAVGDPCGSTADGAVTLCAASGFCLTGGVSTSGMCEAAAPEGAACDVVAGPNCMPPAACLDNVCTIFNPATCH